MNIEPHASSRPHSPSPRALPPHPSAVENALLAIDSATQPRTVLRALEVADGMDSSSCDRFYQRAVSSIRDGKLAFDTALQVAEGTSLAPGEFSNDANRHRSLRYFLVFRAAHLGNARAQSNVGDYLLKSSGKEMLAGVSSQRRTAERYLRHAATQGVREAQAHITKIDEAIAESPDGQYHAHWDGSKLHFIPLGHREAELAPDERAEFTAFAEKMGLLAEPAQAVAAPVERLPSIAE